MAADLFRVTIFERASSYEVGSFRNISIDYVKTVVEAWGDGYSFEARAESGART